MKLLMTTLMTSLTALALGGCGVTVLPTSQSLTKSSWPDYAAAKSAYARIELDKTTAAELKVLGFDPDALPNTRVLNYVDVVNLFGASFKLDELPAGVRACVAARDACQGYVMRGQQIRNKRVGNVAADLLGFGRKTNTTGWEFSTTLVLVGNVVTYKLWNGTPTIETASAERNPLGPLQNMGGLVPKPW